MSLLNAVVDLSHHNSVTSFADAKSAGVVGVIHKATQGTEFADATYDSNRAAALDAGLLWGAYHFARGGDVAEQVDHFLSVANVHADQLLVLDFEPNSKQGTMTLSEAEEFVTLVAQRTGRFPGLYSGQSFLTDAVGSRTTTVLSQCWLWIARYGPAQPVVPPAWRAFSMWQYTDGSAGMQPHQVNGIGRCDRDKFNGDETGLRQLWSSGTLTHPLPVAPSSPTRVAATRSAEKARGKARRRVS